MKILLLGDALSSVHPPCSEGYGPWTPYPPFPLSSVICTKYTPFLTGSIYL